MIGIIGAMQIEVENIINLMESVKIETFAHIKFYKGKINNSNCVVSVCAPGKVNAAVCAQRMITNYKPEVIISVGVAGSLKDDIKIGDVVVADSVVQHDVDTSAVGDERGFISGLGLVKISCAKDVTEKIKSAAAQCNEDFHVGCIATGDQFISNKEKLLDIKNTFKAVACEMESGSIGQVCAMNNVKLAALKVISDNADAESGMDYEKFKMVASQKIAKIIAKAIFSF